MLKYLLAVVAVLTLIGWLCFHVHNEHPVIAPPAVTKPAPSAPTFSGPPVVPVEPEPAGPVHKPVHKHYHKRPVHRQVHSRFIFHGQRCYTGWVILPGSVTCVSSGEQFLPDELEWSIPK